MQKTSCRGIVKEFSKDGILIEVDINGTKQERLFYDNHDIVFKGIGVGDKIILETIFEGNSMTLNVKKEDDYSALIIGSRGNGKSEYVDFLKNSFVIDTKEETEKSFVEKLKKAKNQEKAIVIFGSGLINSASMVKSLINSDLKATIITDDYNDIIETKNLDAINIDFKPDFDLIRRPMEGLIKPINSFKEEYDYCKGKRPEIKFKNAGNNRKIKKRKKAKNGRSKK